MKCITCSQILLTCDPQYFQGRIPFKFLKFLIILRRQGRKKNGANVSECLHNVTSVMSNVTLRFAPLATGPNFGSSDFIDSLGGQFEKTLSGMSSDPHNEVNSLDLILMRLATCTLKVCKKIHSRNLHDQKSKFYLFPPKHYV